MKENEEPTPIEVDAPPLTLDQTEIPDELCSVINLIITIIVVLGVLLLTGVGNEVRNLFGL